jgi:hypothetical protein
VPVLVFGVITLILAVTTARQLLRRHGNLRP